MRKKKDINSPLFGYTEDVFPLLQKIAGDSLKNLVEMYLEYGKKMKLVPYALVGCILIALVHNYLIISDVYSNGMEIIIIGVWVLSLLPLLALLGILINGQIRIRRAFRKVATQAKLPIRKSRKEFNLLMKSTFGGYGI